MLSPEARFRPFQEELAGWFRREVVDPKGEHYVEDVELHMHVCSNVEYVKLLQN